MKTIYDWITVAIFCAIITLFLSRSVAETKVPGDFLIHYLVASVGCAVANYLGNEGYHFAAAAMIAASVGYVFYFLRPLAR
ncbi:XrtV sorting system accessory protein [Sphingomonas immobilis]|uniref:Uncharacterized protein n=1 Tax=Sphingomonas immobilis TaxID=3063997 RepID=A0ABT9A4H2_9SPHN|nr:XrtV sorting system accessory protein [Sphingomonas sp. CA1-15]MDO7844115.1 hypothetical protein [Sphingomonas sp. CA1-15]